MALIHVHYQNSSMTGFLAVSSKTYFPLAIGNQAWQAILVSESDILSFQQEYTHFPDTQILRSYEADETPQKPARPSTSHGFRTCHSQGRLAEPLEHGEEAADESLISLSVVSSATTRSGFKGRTADTKRSYAA